MADQYHNKYSSRLYQDYVIRDGRFVGQFEEMSKTLPKYPGIRTKPSMLFSATSQWHCYAADTRRACSTWGVLGYMATRLKSEISELARVVGLDVSETVIIKAAAMFPEIEFRAGTIHTDLGGERFDVVVSKDVLWYVLDDLHGYLAALVEKSKRWVYIGQSFPERSPFLGEEILPNAVGLLSFVEEQGHRVSYFLVERDAEFHNREYAHILIEIEQ